VLTTGKEKDSLRRWIEGVMSWMFDSYPGHIPEVLSRLDPNHRNRGANVNIVALIVQVVSGAVGGNIAGALMKKFNLGPIGNSLAGIIGGGIGGQLLSMVTSGGAAAAGASAGGMDMSSILSSVAGGGVGGAVLMAIIGLIKSQISKS
jgi:uncharacterized membrane protein YeaQ/YmgE (transglycosylase-associated protein family)